MIFYASIVKAIYSHSQKFPDKIAIIAPDREISYASFWKCIQGTSSKLCEMGICEGDRIILEASHTVDSLFAVMQYILRRQYTSLLRRTSQKTG